MIFQHEMMFVRHCLFVEIIDDLINALHGQIMHKTFIILYGSKLIIVRSHSKMTSLQCEYVRIFELITSVNVTVSSPLSHKNTMAGFEGEGAMVTTSKYALWYNLGASCLQPPCRLHAVGLYLAIICQFI